MKRLIRFFAGNTTLVGVLTLVVLFAGFQSFRSMNRESYPHVDRMRLSIATVSPGASPSQVELNVTIPLEDALKAVDGIQEYESFSYENYSLIKVVLDRSVRDAEKVKADIRRAVDNAEIPREAAEKPVIREWKVSAMPVMEIGLSSRTLTYGELRVRARDLKRRIMEISSVATVNTRGLYDREVRIELNLEKVKRRYLSLEEVIQALRANNIQVTGGVHTEWNRDKTLTVSSRYQDIGDVRDVIIRSAFDGPVIRLGEIAVIREGFRKEDSRVRFNGRRGIALLPVKKETADIVAATDLIKQAVEDFRKELGDADAEIVVLWDMSVETRQRLKTASTNALVGLLLVVLVLFIALSFKNAFWTAVGIPFSIAFALIFLRFFGTTINSVSLIGVIVVLGMIVDNAIIISENIFRHRLGGKSWEDASVDATGQMASPVIASGLTTIAAFIPLYMLKGFIGDFAKEIPLVVMLVLTGCILQALFILPNHIAHSFGFRKAFREVRERAFMVRLQERYQRTLRGLLTGRGVLLLLSVFLLLFGVSYFILFSGRVVKYIDFPAGDTYAFYIHGRVRGGQNLDFTEEKAGLIERALAQYPSTVLVSSAIVAGEAGYPEKFSITVNLTPAQKRRVRADSVISNIRAVIDADGGFTNVYYMKENSGPPTGRDIRIHVIGNNDAKRRELADSVFATLQGIAGVRDHVRSDEENKTEIRILVDYVAAARLGVSPASIAQTVRIAFHGVTATEIQTPEEMVGYNVVLRPEDRDRLENLFDLRVLNRQNRLVPLRGLISLREEKRTSQIQHFGGDRTTILEADLDKKIITPSEVSRMLRTHFGDFEKENPGFRIVLGGEMQQTDETLGSMKSAGLLAVLLIFSIIILLYRSITQSFIILLTLPFALIGVALVLLVHRMPLSAMALFGMVGLGGVVVNNAIVMVDYINELRDRKKEGDIREAITQGAARRIRPILLTSITTLVGLLPNAYGLGGSDHMMIPTTRVMAWGLLFSTLLTLFLTPALYYLEHRAWEKGRALWQRLSAGGRGRKAALLLLVCLLLSSGAGSLRADPEAVSEGSSLTIEDFLQESLRNNPEITALLTKVEKADSLVLQARAIHDLILGLDLYRSYEKPFQVGSSGIESQSIDTFSGGVKGILPFTGTRIRAGVDYHAGSADYRETVYAPFPVSVTQSFRFTNPVLSFGLSQPLLKNWMGTLDSFPLKQARLHREMTAVGVKESVEAVVSFLCEVYLDWHLLHAQRGILRESIRNAEVLLEQLGRKYRDGLVDEGDVSKIRSQLAEYGKAEALLSARYESRTARIQLWRHAPESAVPPEPADPDSFFGGADAVFDPAATRQMRLLDLSGDLLTLELKKARQELLPELDLSVSVRLQDFATNRTGLMRAYPYAQYAAGLSLAWPIGLRGGRGRWQEAKAGVARWESERKDFVRNLTQGHAEAVRLREATQAVLGFDGELIRQAGIQIRDEERKYAQGRGDLFFVIQARNNLLRHRMETAADQVSLYRIRLQIMALEDGLLERPGKDSFLPVR